MADIKLVLVDKDEKYLLALERKFIQELGDTCEIEVITDIHYLIHYFSTPRSIDILLIQERLYDARIERHDVGNIYLLTEEDNRGSQTESMNLERIYKYTSVKEIYNRVINSSPKRVKNIHKSSESTKIITIYSSVGGMGKTTVAMGLSSALHKCVKKVLYVGTDNLQTFGYYIGSNACLKGNIENQMVARYEDIYPTIRPMIENIPFAVVPPFSRALSAIGIKMSHYLHLIEAIKQSREYDFIVVDTATDFTEDTTQLMSISDHVILLTGQNTSAAYKTDLLLTNIDCSNTNRFLFVCNQYQTNAENMLITEHFINRIRIGEYIPFNDNLLAMTNEELGNMQSFQKLALRFL